VNPCIRSTGGACQTSSVANFNVTNTGNTNINITIQANDTVAGIILFGTLTNDPDASPSGINDTAFWTVVNPLAVGATQMIWVWANFTDMTPQSVPIEILINSTRSG